MRFSGRKKKTPPSEAYRNNVSRLTAAKSRDRNKERGTSGAWTRASTITNRAKAARPSNSGINSRGSLQLPTEDSINAYVTPPRPNVASAPPVQSRLRDSDPARLSGTYDHVSIKAATASGILIKNT